MLQLSQVLLPVDHQEDDLRRAVLKQLGARDEEVISVKVKQRAIDARRGHVEFSFTLLVEVKDEAR
ncbi:MAG: dependent oxidoreductase, partial [Prosthecobacter sp.]|nr:dependent oxidoreductase [Prosthecobacter sp.]